ncbi:hypothetical protein [Paenibacillus sacheonensis]|uniref:Uncharacterized protein n=1 Tax=Paenibacillus sacheonensis TaxID=742054 RepID=A0A7X5C339_9BACL|nr:hypothetical protein [Paenibacillus sacheonensis]MBM7567070.1 tetratricopeptide (TPR) repeat protein [Paenibacillus sacheonensis]NBC70999.1 hypothetical protein [Paenibacillus sacheonensis]
MDSCPTALAIGFALPWIHCWKNRFVITHGIIEHLDGPEAAKRYRTEHLNVLDIRVIAVDRALSDHRYDEAKELCEAALEQDKPYGRPTPWAKYLEQIYGELGDKEKQLEMILLILKRGESSYYSKLRTFYESDGTWEQRKSGVLDELSKVYAASQFAGLLGGAGEWPRLLNVVKDNAIFIEHYGKQLASRFPAETYMIYEHYIMNEAAAATERRKYKGVCKLLKSYYNAGAREEAMALIRHLIEKYPRRPAMLDELESLSRRLVKK